MNKLDNRFIIRLRTSAQHLVCAPSGSTAALTTPCDQLHSEQKASIAVEPKVALYDEKVKILLQGFPCDAKVTIHGQVVQGRRKILFASCGHYATDSWGCVDMTQQPSLGGTFTGLEPMGIIWSLRPAPGQPQHTRMAINFTDRPFIISLRTYLGHLSLTDLYGEYAFKWESLASTDIERWYRDKDVTRIEVEEGNVRGALYLPPGDGPFQGVIDMFGAAGGIIEYRSALLASRGFAALSLPYFGYKDLPDSLHGLDYAYFEEAVNWLSSHRKVCKKGIGVIAVSKGTQNAFLMGAYSSKVTAVIAINGYPFVTTSDISYKGRPFHKAARYLLNGGETTDEGYDLRYALQTSTEVIPIWKNKAKYLLFVCLDDYQCKPDVHEELLAVCPEEKKQDIEVVKYPGAGHLLEPPYNALCRTSFNKYLGREMKWGGHPKEHAHAQEDSWQRTLDFFRKNIPTS